MIMDFISLLDLDNFYEGKKYIIYVQKEVQE